MFKRNVLDKIKIKDEDVENLQLGEVKTFKKKKKKMKEKDEW